ncbi:MAG: hypothetical protein AB7S41_18540 [Parvibaculaceae bacterium]
MAGKAQKCRPVRLALEVRKLLLAERRDRFSMREALLISRLRLDGMPVQRNNSDTTMAVD